MELTIYFKARESMHLTNVKQYAVNGNNDNVLKIDTLDGKTHFINFNEFVACIEEGTE